MKFLFISLIGFLYTNVLAQINTAPVELKFIYNNSLERHRDGATMEWDEMVHISELSGEIHFLKDSIFLLTYDGTAIISESFVVMDYFEGNNDETNEKYFACTSDRGIDVVFIVISDPEIGMFVRLDSNYIEMANGSFLPLNIIAFNFDPDLKN